MKMLTNYSYRGSGDVQHSNHAGAAAVNVLRDVTVLTDGMMLKAVLFGSLLLAMMV